MYTPVSLRRVKTYLDWILGPEGQEIVGELGFVPLQ
jgi:ABC-type phosphate transport system substrate-binding protein